MFILWLVIKPAAYRQRTAIDDLNDEFRNQLRVGPPTKKKPIASKTQIFYIDQTSTPEEICEWLAFKGFSLK